MRIKWMAALLLAVLLTGCKSTDYSAAMDYYDQGDYITASGMFRSLDDYKDSAQMADSCDYLLAVQAYEDGRYDQALQGFSRLGEYEDSAEYAKKCGYQQALELLNQGEYTKAREGFLQLGEYSDAPAQAERAEKLQLCGQIAGKWEFKRDILPDFLGENQWITREMLQKQGIEEIIVGELLEVDRDGTFRLTAHPCGEQAAKKLLPAVKKLILDYYTQEIKSQAEGTGYTLKKLYNAYGVADLEGMVEKLTGKTVDAMAETILPREVENVLSEVAITGTYTIEGGKILFRSQVRQQGIYDPGMDTLCVEQGNSGLGGRLVYTRQGAEDTGG